LPTSTRRKRSTTSNKRLFFQQGRVTFITRPCFSSLLLFSKKSSTRLNLSVSITPDEQSGDCRIACPSARQGPYVKHDISG
jgi:hypothetical protein